MPRLVFVPRYLKMKSARQLKNYVNYIATRETAETFSPTQSEMEATEEQKIIEIFETCIHVNLISHCLL